MKKKLIAVKGVAKLEKKELANTKGAACRATWSDGQSITCYSFHWLDAPQTIVRESVSTYFYY